MTESEIAFQVSELFDRWWVVHQWWVSVSFVLIAVAHFAGDRLNLVITGVILGLYTAFSIWLYLLSEYNEDVMIGFLRDLRALEGAGQLQSHGAKAYLEGMFNEKWSIWGSFARFGTFLSVIGYLSYTAIRSSRSIER